VTSAVLWREAVGDPQLSIFLYDCTFRFSGSTAPGQSALLLQLDALSTDSVTHDLSCYLYTFGASSLKHA